MPSADEFLAAAPPPSADAFLAQGAKPRADDFLNGKKSQPGGGFWADFGQGTGGAVGLLTAPFTSSIPAEVVKAAYHDPETYALAGVPGLIYKKVEAFLAEPGHKPLPDRIRDSFHELIHTAKERPGAAVGSLVHGIAADPELFFMGELTGARGVASATEAAAKTAGAGARTARAAGAVAGGATTAAGTAAIGGGAELASELGEDRPFDPGAIGTSAAIGALAAPLQVRLKGETPKLTPAEIDDMLAPKVHPDAATSPKAEVHPVAEGYLVRMEGESEGRTFPTREEAEAAKREIEAVGSAHAVLGNVPQGTKARSRLIFENPFSPENMRKWVERPKEDVPKAADSTLRFFTKLGASAAIGAGIGAVLDRDDPSLGAEFGAAITVVPRALSRLAPDKRISVSEVINARNGTLAVMARHVLQFKAAIDSAVPEPLRRSAISLALEKHEGITLNPTEARVAQSVREFFDAMGGAAVDAGVIKEMLTDYVTHIVEEDPTFSGKNRDTIGRIVDVLAGGARGGAPSGRQFAQHRRYATFDELHQALRGSGLKIKTGDIGEIMAIYSKAMFKAITDKRLIEALKVTPVEGMRALVLARDTGSPREPPRAGETVEGESHDLGPAPARLAPPDRLPVPGGTGAGGTERTPLAAAGEGAGFHLPPEPPPGETAQRFAARGPAMLLQPIDKIDSNYTVLPSRQLAGYAVHKDIAPQLNFVFSARDPHDVTLGLMALNQASKRAVVSFSLFHAKSLADAFIGAVGTRAFTGGGPYKQAQRAVEMFMRGGSNEGVDDLLRHGLVLQMPEDIAKDVGTAALARIASIVDQALPVSATSAAVKVIAKFNDKLDHFTFSTLQTGFKLITGLDAYERLIKKGLSREVAGKLAASYANDIYGSLDWFRVANDVGSRLGRDLVYGFFNPNGRRWAQLLVFAPDWTVSTFRAAYKALPGAVDDAALSALHRRYLVKSAVYYLTVANAINLVTAGHSIFDNENPTRVQLKDGRTMQWSKHSMEPLEWMRDPIQTAANKLAFLPREAVQQIIGKEYISAHDAAPDIDNRAEHLARQFAPISAQQGLAGGGATSVMGLVGMPVYGKDPEQKREARLAKKKHELEKKKRAAEYYKRQNR
jgi:hypothetical protein